MPFVVLVGLHKLSPLFPHDPALTFNDFKVVPVSPVRPAGNSYLMHIARAPITTCNQSRCTAVLHMV